MYGVLYVHTVRYQHENSFLWYSHHPLIRLIQVWKRMYWCTSNIKDGNNDLLGPFRLITAEEDYRVIWWGVIASLLSMPLVWALGKAFVLPIVVDNWVSIYSFRSVRQCLKVKWHFSTRIWSKVNHCIILDDAPMKISCTATRSWSSSASSPPFPPRQHSQHGPTTGWL